MVKANKQKGEVSIEGPDGETYRLCLTLGAIAQIEEGLGVKSLLDIQSVMGEPSMGHLLTIFVAMLNGGGHTEITKKDMMVWDVKFVELSEKIKECFAASGFGDQEEEEEEEDSPKE